MTRQGIGRGLFVLLILAGAGYLAALGSFRLARRRLLTSLETGGTLVRTSRGPIEYARAGEGPVVVVLPGSFGGYDQAMAVGRDLVERGFSVIGVSRPGYLRTPLETGRTPAEQAAATAELIDSLRVAPAAVLGISGGGPAALEMAARYPDRVAALVLIAALTGPKVQPPAPPPPPDWRDRLLGDDFSAWWQLVTYQRSGRAVLDAPIFAPDTKARLAASPALLDRYFELAWFRYPTALRWSGYQNDREQFGRFDFDGFEAITAPTLVVHGTLDRNVPIENGARAARRIAGAKFLEIDGGDHYVAIARADTVWAETARFLQAIRP